VDDDRAVGGQRLAQGAAQARHVVAVDDAGIGPVELLPQQARGPEGLQRLLQLRAEALEGGADAAGQLGQLVLDALAGVPQLGIQAHAIEVARQRPDVGRDRHPVVVEDDDDRRPQAAAWWMASKATPPVMAPSPMTATTLPASGSSRRRMPSLRPTA
jgi:hypothetical protein